MPIENRRIGPFTVDGTTTSESVQITKIAGPNGIKLLFGNITGLTGTLEASIDGTNFYPLASVTDAGVAYGKGATITCVDGMSLYFAITGYVYVQFTRTGGSGPFYVVPMEDADEFIAAVDLALAIGSGFSVQGNVAHDAVDSGNPVKIGYKAVDHGANPTAVAAGDRVDAIANRHGIPFVLGGHPNPVLISVRVLDSDNGQTNVAMVTVSSGTKIAVTRYSIKADGSNSSPVNGTLGFAAATLATPNTTSGAGILEDFQGIPAGQGIAMGDGGAILGIGADGEDLRYTCEDPAGGAITFSATYFTTPA